MNPYDIGWLAGILDGEGSVVLVQHSEVRSSDGRRGISPRLLLAVADFSILQKYTSLLSELGIPYGYVRQLPGGRRQHTIVQVWIANHEAIIKLLKLVLPYLTLKQRQAEFIVRFCEWKMENSERLCQRGGPIDRSIQDKEQTWWTEYRTVYMGKARSHARDLDEAIREKATPIRWPS